MGCSSCGNKKRRISSNSGKTQPRRETTNTIRNGAHQRMRSIKPSKNVEVLKGRPSTVLKELSHTNQRINMLNESSAGRYVYLVGYKSSCSECQYLKVYLNVREG